MFSIVITTINVPDLLRDYREFADKYDLDMNIIVVPDGKTPKEAERLTERVGGEYLTRNTLDIHADDARRQEGILRAIEREDDFVVLLDDDNLLNDDISHFERVGDINTYNAWHSTNGWINPCEAMDKPHIYHRGFPYSKVGGEITKKEETNQVVVNAGLWTNSADVDAIFHLMHDTNTQELKEEFILGEGQFAPFNSQNTAILGDTLAGYFFRPKRGDEVTRYSDIFASLFYEKIMHHLGGTVLYGRPLSNHDRNPHDLLPEVIQETKEMIWLEDMLPSLVDMELSGESWGECLWEVVDNLRGKRDDTNEFIDFYKSKIEQWLKAVKRFS